MNRYLSKVLILLGLALYGSSALCAPIKLLSPDPIIPEMMQDGLFVHELISKRPELLRAGGGYPAFLLGGSIKLWLYGQNPNRGKSDRDFAKVKIGHQDENTGLFNATFLLNRYLMAAAPLKYKNGRLQRFEQFVVFIGDSSRNLQQTDLGFFTLPFNLSGGIGRFLSPIVPWRSELVYSNSFSPFFQKWIASNASVTQDKELRAFLRGQKDFGSYIFSVIVLPTSYTNFSSTSRNWFGDFGLIIHPELKVSYANYMFTVGSGYDMQNSWGNVYGSIVSNAFTVKAHRFLRRSSHSRKGNLGFPRNMGHLEGSYQFWMPFLQLPSTGMLGYSWRNRFIPGKHSKNDRMVFLSLKTRIKKYLELGVGCKLGSRRIEDFTVHLKVLF